MTVATQLTPMGLGTGRLASLGSSLSRLQATELIHAAIDHGIRVIDTADTYGSGDAERTIGSALRERSREDCFLISKAGFAHVALPAVFSPLNQIGKKLVQKVSPGRSFSKAYLISCVQKSLKRLGTDHLDAFLLHAAVAGEPTSESWEALEEIRAKGLSRMTGVSSSDVDVVREGLASGQVGVVETPVYVSASHADEICTLCAEQGVPVVANEVLRPQAFLKTRADVWDAVRGRHGVASVSTVQLLIAYAAAQRGVKTVLVGTLSSHHLVDNLQALQYSSSMHEFFAEMKESFA
ncbi:aldo/keto reductase [Granulicella sp. S190]|uniref:aldo/keto reductase n=1 Tax=Granulicella sp. S190 TaxID=1747226 RepID=UPI00131B3B92|nr:aldo/keto reductase [Granulicella sp. S190]